MTRPQLSVIVPTYGRAEHIGPLIDSVLAQEFQDWEMVVAEDASPRREEVRAVVEQYRARLGDRLRYHQNPATLGYDANFRQLVELAGGEFLFVMGDDDRVAPGAFEAVVGAIRRYPRLGVIIRAYAVFQGEPSNVLKVLRHWPEECVFPAGPRAIVAAHRRLVAMAGIVMHRDSAKSFADERFDGTLFYQQWLAANILVERDAVYLPTLLAYFRHNSAGVFGTAPKERGLYTPGVQPPDMHLKMVESLMRIAETVERERGVPIVEHVRRDFANHMYPTLAYHTYLPWKEFYRFYRDLGRQGFAKYPQYHAWFWAVAIIGPRALFWSFQTIRRVFGYSPNLTPFARPESRSATA
jgi:abequosyltransferase